MTENVYTKLRREAGLSLRDMEALMKPMFPRVSAPALTAAEAPTLTGITLTRAADSEFRRVCGLPRRSHANSRLPIRLYLRCTEQTHSRVKRAKELLSYATTQDTLMFLLNTALDQLEKAAHGDATPADGNQE